MRFFFAVSVFFINFVVAKSDTAINKKVKNQFFIIK